MLFVYAKTESMYAHIWRLSANVRSLQSVLFIVYSKKMRGDRIKWLFVETVEQSFKRIERTVHVVGRNKRG